APGESAAPPDPGAGNDAPRGSALARERSGAPRRGFSGADDARRRDPGSRRAAVSLPGPGAGGPRVGGLARSGRGAPAGGEARRGGTSRLRWTKPGSSAAARTGPLSPDTEFKLSGINFKPVIFFRAAHPVSLRVRVFFHRGRPWTFFPDATDYLQGHLSEEEPVEPAENNLSTIAVDFARPVEATRPPWIDAGKPGVEPPPSGDLEGRFPLVPWLAPTPSNVPGAE